MRKITILTVLVVLANHFAIAQTSLPTPKNITATYAKKTRSEDGYPGKNYWQNTADYVINVNFNPTNRLLNGNEEITYFNNSNDTLREIVFKLYPNIYKKGSPRLMKFEDEDTNEGMNIESMSINNSVVSANNWFINATNMSVRIQPLLPKQSMKFTIQFSYTLNKGSHMRTGQIDDGAFFIAYFFPRIAVYDDIDGWNRNQYLGTHEFYNDFCNFKTSITVPNDYMVWATGDLQNCSEVYNDKYCTRIQEAENNDEIR